MQIVLSDFQDQLVRGLSHRMNNILSLFHGYLGLLMEDKQLDPVTLQGLKKIKEGARSASELMERTNALVRPASAVWREINLADLLRQLKPTFMKFCPPKMKFEIECSDSLPKVWTDASRIRIALVELVRNAFESARGHVRIHVTASEGRVQGEMFHASEQPEHWLNISITDDGATGIPVEHGERIYAPFYTTRKKTDNAGLGLTVALGCAQQLRGQLLHRSHPGETTFEFILPSRLEQQASAVA